MGRTTTPARGEKAGKLPTQVIFMDIGTALVASTTIVCFSAVWLRHAEMKMRIAAWERAMREQRNAIQAGLRAAAPTLGGVGAQASRGVASQASQASQALPSEDVPDYENGSKCGCPTCRQRRGEL